jgi:hypothetical protein
VSVVGLDLVSDGTGHVEAPFGTWQARVLGMAIRGGNFIRESGPCGNSPRTVWDTCIIEKKLATDPQTIVLRDAPSCAQAALGALIGLCGASTSTRGVRPGGKSRGHLLPCCYHSGRYRDNPS